MKRSKIPRVLVPLFVLVIWSFSACQEYASHADRVIVIQPFDGFSPRLANHIYEDIRSLHRHVLLKAPIALPQQAFYAPRSRYRAELLIQYLSQWGSADTVVIGLTHKDISTTKGEVADWGILGLGYCPGVSCIVSTFRLSKADLLSQFYKVAVHELGHTQGLPHCPEKTCFMRDAEGGNPLNQEKGFCTSCKSFLAKKGWTF